MPIATATQPKPCARYDDGLTKWRIDLADGTIGDPDTVELDSAERRLLEFGQRSMVGATVVDRDTGAKLLELLGDLAHPRQIVDELIFRHIDDETGPFVELRTIGLYNLGKPHFAERARRYVDDQLQIDAELGENHSGLQRRYQGVLGQLDERRLRGARHERARQHDAVLRMARSGKEFDPTSCFLRRSIIGWHENSIQPLLSAWSRSIRPAVGGA